MTLKHYLRKTNKRKKIVVRYEENGKVIKTYDEMTVHKAREYFSYIENIEIVSICRLYYFTVVTI